MAPNQHSNIKLSKRMGGLAGRLVTVSFLAVLVLLAIVGLLATSTVASAEEQRERHLYREPHKDKAHRVVVTRQAMHRTVVVRRHTIYIVVPETSWRYSYPVASGLVDWQIIVTDAAGSRYAAALEQTRTDLGPLGILGGVCWVDDERGGKPGRGVKDEHMRGLHCLDGAGAEDIYTGCNPDGPTHEASIMPVGATLGGRSVSEITLRCGKDLPG